MIKPEETNRQNNNPSILSWMEELKEVTRREMAKLNVPGVAVGLSVDGADECFGLGVTSVENPLEVTPQTLFRIGSITKTHTATVLFELIEQGRVSLEDQVRKYIPHFQVADEDTAARVTIRHLLNHTSGWLGDYFINTGDGEDALEKFITRMADLPQLTPLGTLYSYNNTAFNVIGRIIEVVTGQNYHAAMQKMLLDPLGLKTSCFFGHDVMLHRFALGHNTEGEQAVIAKPWFESRCDAPCGGLSSSAEEMLRYARFHMADGRTETGVNLLKPETLAQMQTAQLVSGVDEHIGMNWFIREFNGVQIFEHGGSSNGQQAGVWFAPSKQTAFTVLTNLDRGSQLIDTLSMWVEENILGVFRAQRKTQPLSSEKLEEYTGMYLFAAAGDLFSVTIANGGLTMTHILQDTGEAADGPFGIPRQVIPPVSFLSCGEDLFLCEEGLFAGSIFEFLRDADGRVMWFRFGGRVFNRQISVEAK